MPNLTQSSDKMGVSPILLTGAVEHADCTYKRVNPLPTGFLGIRLDCIWWWGSSLNALGKLEYPLITITFRPTLTQIDSSYFIIIIMSRHQHGYPWPSLATSPCHSSPLAGLQGYILCPHIVAVCKFVLVVLLLYIHMWGVHRSTSLMSSSLLLQQCPACLVRLTCIVFMMGGKGPYSWCLVGCCHQDLFNTALNILV